MKSRKNYLKFRKVKFVWSQIGMFSIGPCKKCGRMEKIQIYKHDAWACIYCNEWLDEACQAEDCPFCSNRPDTPYEVYWNEREKIFSDGLRRKRWRQDNYSHKENGKNRNEKKHERLKMINYNSF